MKAKLSFLSGSSPLLLNSDFLPIPCLQNDLTNNWNACNKAVFTKYQGVL